MDPLARRVAARAAGYSGWDPPDDPEEDPPAEELWEALMDALPRGLQSEFDVPQKSEKHGYGDDLTITLEAEISLDDDEDLGGIITVSAWRSTDEDPDGKYRTDGIKAEYSLIAGRKEWDGSTKGHYGDDEKLVRDFKRDVREFVRAIKTEFPASAEKFDL